MTLPNDRADISAHDSTAAATAPAGTAATAAETEAALLAGLNEPQLAAVTHGDGPLLILAGAGSGKTRALTHRIAYLIRARGVRPWEILAITFTNKAAAEMRRRVESLLGAADAQDMWVMTFHSACVRILRREIEHLGYTRNFLIYDDADQLSVMKQVFKELDVPERKITPQAALSAISRAKSELITPRAYERRAGDWFSDYIASAYQRYQERLEAQNALDFDDLINVTVRLFREVPDVLEQYRRRWRYILVDEYQDTNRAQYELVTLLAGGGGGDGGTGRHNLAVVGDDDQSIYGFRGADLRNILEFEKDYPEAKVIRLEQNYRSTQPILEAANHVIKHNLGRKGKRLWTAKAAGDPPTFYRAPDEHDEAAFIISEILRLSRGERGLGGGGWGGDSGREGRGDRAQPLRYSDFCILYRMNAQSRVLEDAFMRHGVPYRIVGGVRFYERKEIKDVLAYLRVIVNPADVVSLERIINVPRRGIGNTTWLRLAETARQWKTTVYQVMRQVAEVPDIAAKTKKAITDFVGIIEYGRKRAGVWAGGVAGVGSAAVGDAAGDGAAGAAGAAFAPGDMPLQALVQAVAETSGILAELQAERTMESATRIENIEELYSVAADFADTSDDPSLEAFLATIALITDLETVDEKSDAVLMMTMHNAKGLEFPVVFIVGLEEGVFPHSRSLDNPNEVEEERRLCYVAITRARERLYLTSAARRTFYGQTAYSALSRFVREIPDELLNDISIEGAGAGAGFGAGIQEGYDEDGVRRRQGWGNGGGRPNVRQNGRESGDGNGRENGFPKTTTKAPSALDAPSTLLAKVGRIGSAAGGMAFPRPADAAAAANGLSAGGTGNGTPTWRFSSGDKIVHPKWGQGIVVATRGQGEDMEVTLAFPELGIKKVMAKYANLRKA